VESFERGHEKFEKGCQTVKVAQLAYAAHIPERMKGWW